MVDIIIEPVVVQQLRMGAPGHLRRARRVIVRKIVLRNGDVQPLLLVPEILLGQGIGVVFRMTQNEEMPVVRALNRKDP